MAFNRSQPRFARRRLFRFLSVLATVYILICVYFWATQVDKILAPRADIPSDPGRMGMAYEDVRVPLLRGGEATDEQLNAFWIPADDPSAPALLYLHGQDATRGRNLSHTKNFHQSGLSVLVCLGSPAIGIRSSLI